MDAQETVVPSGQHYSGANRIPNIKQFMEKLDRDKKDRDAQIDQQSNQQKKSPSEVQAHQSSSQKQGKNRRTVRDPVTGKDVEIDDIDGSMMKEVQDPHVRFPLILRLVEAVGQGRTLSMCTAIRPQRQPRQGHHHQDRPQPVWRRVPSGPGHYRTT